MAIAVDQVLSFLPCNDGIGFAAKRNFDVDDLSTQGRNGFLVLKVFWQMDLCRDYKLKYSVKM